MRIAIHHRKGSFSDRWIEYCKKHEICHRIVNCYDSDIIDQLKDCDGLMWHWSHMDYRAQGYARQLIYSLELMGKKVFPSFSTCWHFDDKLGQKYLLESIDAPLVPSYAFYDKSDALRWAQDTDYPKVFKLRGGAGSSNVSLVQNYKEAKGKIDKAFSKGFKAYDPLKGVRERMWRLRRDKNAKAVFHLLKGFARLAIPVKGMNLLPDQKGYVYFQDFIANNAFDDRVVIVGNRAIFLRRFVRRGDFRASGSGVFDYKPSLIPLDSLRAAFETSRELNAQSIAYDFVYPKTGKPLIVEISYAYSMGKAYDDCPGYWDSDLNWHEAPVDPQRFIIEDFIQLISCNRKAHVV